MNRLLARALVFLMFLSGTVASSQIAAVGSVRGFVKDQQGGVLPGVTVTATSPTVPTPSVAVTDEKGYYRLLNLPPADYRIAAELPGFAKFVREPVTVSAGLNISLDIPMALGSVEQTVEVVAETPLLEVQKATTSVNIGGEFQKELPLTSRSQFADFLEVTPGVAARAGDATGGGRIYMMRGGELENHVIQLDGADMGSFRQNRADRLLTFNTDAISDVQVTTGAVDASTPLGSGAVINVSTKSGTDQFRGAVGTVYTPESWNGNNAGAGTVRFNQILQPDLSLGGPILRGKLWFFGAYRYTRQFSGLGRTAEQVALLSALKPGFTPFNNSVLSNNYYGKLTGQISSRHQWTAFYERDIHPEAGDREWLRRTPRGHDGRRDRRGCPAAVDLGKQPDIPRGGVVQRQVHQLHLVGLTTATFMTARPSPSTPERSSRAATSQERAEIARAEQRFVVQHLTRLEEDLPG